MDSSVDQRRPCPVESRAKNLTYQGTGMKAIVGVVLVLAGVLGCSDNARIFREARIGMPAAKVRGLEQFAAGGVFIGNERTLITSYPGEKPSIPEGRCYAIVVAPDGKVAAKGYLDLESRDRWCLVMRAVDLAEFRDLQEKLGAPPWSPLYPGEQLSLEGASQVDLEFRLLTGKPKRPLPENKTLASGVMAHDWAKLSDCLVGWPFAGRSNDLRGYADYGLELPWDNFLTQEEHGSLKHDRSDVIGIRGSSPSRHGGEYFKLFGLKIGGGSTEDDHPINWKD
jgi:hypothetical protein